MSGVFATEVYPVVVKYAAMRLRDAELESLALVMAWWCWKLHQDANGEELPPSVWAKMGVTRARSQRDLPGVRDRRCDVFDKFTQWQGAGMGEVIDRKAFTADRILAGREELASLKANADERGRALIGLVETERLGTNGIAERLGVSAAAVSQRRRKLAESRE